MFNSALLYLVFGSYMITGYMALVAGLGIIWSPFAAYIAFRRARRRGLDPVRYMLIGAFIRFCL